MKGQCSRETKAILATRDRDFRVAGSLGSRTTVKATCKTLLHLQQSFAEAFPGIAPGWIPLRGLLLHRWYGIPPPRRDLPGADRTPVRRGENRARTGDGRIHRATDARIRAAPHGLTLEAAHLLWAAVPPTCRLAGLPTRRHADLPTCGVDNSHPVYERLQPSSVRRRQFGGRHGVGRQGLDLRSGRRLCPP